MSFSFKETHLRRLCELNFFPVPADGMILFGLRGALSTDVDDCEFRPEHTLDVKDLNYTNPRCTIGQWLPKEKKIAVFPGSTIPHRSYIKTALARHGIGANQLATGFYADYRKGVHKAGKPTAHDAFKQTEARPIRRSADDFDYQNDDLIEFSNPFDNMHAAWCQSANGGNYASAGCQVIVGFPKCALPNHKTAVGAWRIFKENAYQLAQNSFPYALFNGTDAQRVAVNENKPLSVRLRYGSKGDLVKKLQKALQKDDFYEGELDDNFKERTWRAVMNFQTIRFGPLEDDGIVGPTTAAALDLNWLEK
ncbi:MAG: peptidoglycan-binding domain-containing protein [Pyrinomonadaceae bacterium]